MNVTCQENCLLNGIVSTEKCKIFHWPDGCKYSQNLGAHPKYAVTPSGKGSSQLSCSVQIMKIIVLDTVICSFRNENMLRLNKSDPFVPTRPRVESFSSLLSSNRNSVRNKASSSDNDWLMLLRTDWFENLSDKFTLKQTAKRTVQLKKS